MDNNKRFNDALRNRQVNECYTLVSESIKTRCPQYPSGIAPLDAFIPGFLPGTLTVFAPDAEADETVLLQAIFCNITEAGTSALFITLNWNENHVMMTCLSRRSHVSLQSLSTGLLRVSDFSLLLDGCAAICDQKKVNILALIEVDSVLLEKIVMDAVENNGVKIIILDDATQVRLPSRIPFNQTELSFILRKVKRIAAKNGVPIITSARACFFEDNRTTNTDDPLNFVDNFIRLTVPRINLTRDLEDTHHPVIQRAFIEKNGEGNLGSFQFQVNYWRPSITFPVEGDERELDKAAQNPSLFCF